MPSCETCGNDYDKTFQVVMSGKAHVFDSFECAIQALAPACVTCRTRVLGHGLEAGGRLYCCNHCASRGGATGLKDRS
jgi:hypothetical protein